VPLIKVCISKNMSRPMCQACEKRPAAVNCYHKSKTYYRKLCDNCIRKGRRKKPAVPRWSKAGYKKKLVCDRCGFRARYSKQTIVYHMDGDLNNCNLNNLKTICLNCSVEVMRLDLPWKVGDLDED
jgi:hypothetical protein